MSFSDLVSKKLKEKAKSKSQRRLMGWAKACDEGETDCPERVKNVAQSFSDKAELKKFAKTKHKGLPEKVDEVFGRRPHDDDWGDWEHERRRDKELDRRWEDEQKKKQKQKPEQDLEEGPAYGAEKWDDFEGDQGAEEEMQAWTGGSGPPSYKEMDIRTQKLVRKAYQQQLGEFASGWGEDPDDDTKQIFWNRAMHDAWATTRQKSEDMSLSDLDHENTLGETELSTATSDASPDKKDEFYFMDSPKDAGSPEWHEPKPDYDTIEHRSNLRGVIQAGVKGDMANKAYKNGEQNKPKYSKKPYKETIRVNHPTKGAGTVVAMNEGLVVIEWDSLNLRPLGPETLTKAEAQYVTVTERYSGDPDDAEMGPKAKKKKDKDKDEVEEDLHGYTRGGDSYQGSKAQRGLTMALLNAKIKKLESIDNHEGLSPEGYAQLEKLYQVRNEYMNEPVTEGNVVQMGGKRANPMAMSPQQITVLRNRFASLERIDPMSPTYKKLVQFLDNSDPDMLRQLADADIKFVSMLASHRLEMADIRAKKKGEFTEDQYEQQPSFQVAPPPSMTIFQDQETDEDWSADPLSTQRGADAAGEGDAPEGEMEEPDDAPDDLNIDHQELPDSGRAEQIAGEVFQAFDGEGGSHNEIDYTSDKVDFAKQNDNSHNKEDGGEAPRQNDTERDDSEGEESKPKKNFPARDKGSDEGESEDKGEDPREPKEDKEPESDDDDSEDKKEKADESLKLSDFDIEGILD